MKPLLLVLLVTCALAAVEAAEKKIWAKSFLGHKAPDFVVEKWLSAEPDRKGKWVLIDFWATWCGPCRKAIPELNTFHQKFGDKLVVIGVSDEEEAVVKKFKQVPIQYFSALDPKRRMYRELEVEGIPHVIIVDPEGIVRWEGYPLHEGYELTESVVAELIGAKTAK